MKIETERLVLRDYKKSDAKSILEGINSLNVSQYLLVVPYPYTDKDALWWVNHCEEKQKEIPRKSYEFGIVIKPEKEIVGGVGLSDVRLDEKSAHIGYWLAEKYWRKGYVSEAAKRIIDFAFEDLGLEKIIIPVFAENIGSNALAQKVGGKLVEVKKNGATAKSTGKTHDENIYEVTRASFRK
jgi:[ribosomal protein S5]-alanine N-acetyltransferase